MGTAPVSPANKRQSEKSKKTTRGATAGFKSVARTKRKGTGVVRVPEGQTLNDGIRQDRLDARTEDLASRPPRSRHTRKSPEQVRKDQVDIAFRKLGLGDGEQFARERKLAALFMQAWLAAEPVENDREGTRTRLAERYVLVYGITDKERKMMPIVTDFVKRVGQTVTRSFNEAK